MLDVPISTETQHATSVGLPASLGRTVLKNAWFPLARTRLIKPGKPISRMIDQCPIVLWRDGTGTIRAMENRCVHRRAALSGGKIIDGNLRCPCHGWRYDSTGACVRIPVARPGREDLAAVLRRFLPCGHALRLGLGLVG